MRKKFFSHVVVCVAFLASLIGVVSVLAYGATKVRAMDSSVNELKNLLSSATEKEIAPAAEPTIWDDDYRLYQQCYAELVWQSNQENLLYCAELEQPVIRAVAESNWNLIEDAFIFNASSQVDLDIIEVSPCALGVTEFYYLPADDRTSESETPPESGWIALSPNEQGNYLLPLKEGESINGSYYTVFKYVIYDYTYYGMICLSTIF